MTTLDEFCLDLSKYCAPDRPELAQPWSDRDYTYASDGVVAIRLPRIATVPLITATPGHARVSDAIDKMLPKRKFDAVIWVRDVIVPPAIDLPPDPCRECYGSGQVTEIKCRNCDGNGYIKCPRCKSDTDCDECDGYGSTTRAAPKGIDGTIDCSCCDGAGDMAISRDRTHPQAMKVGRYMIQRRTFLKIAGLPNARIDALRSEWFLNEHDKVQSVNVFDAKPVQFVFDGGEGAVMPMRGSWSEASRGL